MKTVYCDESVWMPVAKGLRQRGWEVKTTHEEETLGDTDREQLSLAVEKNYILLTFDDDFLSLVEGEGLEHSGIIYVNQAGKKIGEVVKKVDKCLSQSPKLSDIRYL
jgi:predicted nuclease of predicted toxin-antitoxin system